MEQVEESLPEIELDQTAAQAVAELAAVKASISELEKRKKQLDLIVREAMGIDEDTEPGKFLGVHQGKALIKASSHERATTDTGLLRDSYPQIWRTLQRSSVVTRLDIV